MLMVMCLGYYGDRNDLLKLLQCEDRPSLYTFSENLLLGLILRCDIAYSIDVGAHHIIGAQ